MSSGPHVNAKFIISATDLSNCPESNLPEIILMGRSNVGKSSFINTVVNQKKLARTSSSPGRTQLINYFGIELGPKNKPDMRFYFVDLPGYGYSKVSKAQQDKWSKTLSKFIQERENIKLAVQIIDLRHDAQKKDLDTVAWLEKSGIPYIVVATKEDKLNQKDKAKNTKSLKAAFPNCEDFIVFSSEKRKGVSEFWKCLASKEFA